MDWDYWDKVKLTGKVQVSCWLQSQEQRAQLSPAPWHWQWGSQGDKGLSPLLPVPCRFLWTTHTWMHSGSQEGPCCRGRVKLTRKCWTQPPDRPGGSVCYKSTFLVTSLNCFDCSKHQKPVHFNKGQVVSWICKSGLLFFKTYFNRLEYIDSAINSSSGESTAFPILLSFQVFTVFSYFDSKLESREQNILRILQFSKCEFLKDFQY